MTQEVTLDVNGMSCASCAERIEKALKVGTGVIQASVDLGTETAHVHYFDDVTSAADVAALLTNAGYPATINTKVNSEKTDHKAAEISRLGHLTRLVAVLTLPVFVIEMGTHLISGMHQLISTSIGLQNSRLLQFVLTKVVLFGPGLQFYTKGFPALLKGAPDMNSLVALGTSAAYGFSVVSTFTSGLLPEGTANVYHEAAAVITVLNLLGRYLQARKKGHTGEAIRKLAGLQARTARVERHGEVQAARTVTFYTVTIEGSERIGGDCHQPPPS